MRKAQPLGPIPENSESVGEAPEGMHFSEVLQAITLIDAYSLITA